MRPYTFHRVLGPESSQADAYCSVGMDAVDAITNGYNAAIVAYGQVLSFRFVLNTDAIKITPQTGSGKTYSMMGDAVDPGVVPQVLEQLFKRLAASNQRFSVVCSFVQM